MRHFLYLIPLLLFTACVKDKPVPAATTAVQFTSSRKIFIVNEGNFGSGNGSVSLLDEISEVMVEDVFKSKNNAMLGDVVQSMSKINGKYFIVVNGSGKIVVCNSDLQKIGEIGSLTSPRFILGITPQKAYVSDLYAKGVNIIDLNTLKKTGTISCGGWTEQMAAIYNKVFVSNLRGNHLFVVNSINDAVEDSIFVGPNAGSLLLDKEDKLWVLSSGNQSSGIKSVLSKIDPRTNKVQAKFTIGSYGASNLCSNAGRDSLYFINSGIYRFGIQQDPTLVLAFINNGSSNFYGLGIDPFAGRIFVSDALDYTQRSAIYVYDINGAKLKTYKAGVNANSFYFE